MSYSGKSKVLKSGVYANRLYFDEHEYGNPPPLPPDRYLLQEDSNFLLQEDGNRILLEVGTPS